MQPVAASAPTQYDTYRTKEAGPRTERGRSDEELLEDLAVFGHWLSPSVPIEINISAYPNLRGQLSPSTGPFLESLYCIYPTR
jgi:hypothetical protein